MSANLHLCAAPGCAKQVSRGLLMCIAHWRMVPSATQREVKRAWRAYQRAGLDERAPYLAAVKQAREAVSAREVKRQARRDEGQVGLFDESRSNG